MLKNKINGKMYIGKTNDLYKRLSGHKKDRRSITHFTRAVDKHGIGNFDVVVLEECRGEKLATEREIFWIKEYNTYLSSHYNSTPGGDGFLSGERHPFYGKKRPPEVIKKISESKKKNHPFRGKRIPWLENSRPVGEKHWKAKEYIVTSPSNKEIRIKSLSYFCNQNELPQSNMWKVAKGLREHCKQWKCREVVPDGR